MNIDELAKERVNLQLTLQAMSMWNTAGQKFDDLVEAEKKRIEAVKRLNEVDAMINKYTDASAYQSSFSQ